MTERDTTRLLDDLVERAARWRTPSRAAPGDGVARPMPSLTLTWSGAVGALDATLYDPVVCLVLQGRKDVSIGEETLSLGRGTCLLVSHVLPVQSRITAAPYLVMAFAVDLATIRGLNDEAGASAGPRTAPGAAETQRADRGLLDALTRYLALADAPADARVLGPLVSRELHYRLLSAPFGGMLRHLVHHDSHGSAIGRAIGHIRGDIRARLEIPEFARRVGMSPSSFHRHFRSVTSTTPLQYQKESRLIEARRLLRTGGASVSGAAYEVGYESPSQFSREYARTFGVSPRLDLASADGS